MRRRSISPLPSLSRATPPGYPALSPPQVALLPESPTQNFVTQNMFHTPPPSQNLVQKPSPIQYSPSVSTPLIVSTTGGHSPIHVTSSTRGPFSSMGKNIPMGPPTVNIPLPNITMVVPPTSQG